MKTFAFAALALLANGQQTPSTTASAAAISTTAGGAAPVDPALLPPIVPTDPRFLSCQLSACSNRIIEITPAENFIMDCAAPNGCAGAQIYINVGNDPRRPQRAVENIEEILFQEAGSGEGASIYITNTLAATGHVVEVNDIVCEVAGACTGLTVHAGDGVDFSSRNMDCAAPGACVGCTIVQGATVTPCESLPVASQPAPPVQGLPAAPQQPQFPVPPQQQQPQFPVQPQPQQPIFPAFPQAPVQPQYPGVPAQPQYPAPVLI